MSATERRKGAAYEREVARDCRAVGFDVERTSRGVVQAGKGDVSGIPDLHIECKRQERLAIPAWTRQAEADAPEGAVPVVVYRQSNERSRAVVPWSWLLGLLARLDGEGKLA